MLSEVKNEEKREAFDQAAREEFAVAKTAEAKKLVAAFFAHVKVSNAGGMQSCLRKMKSADIQIGLIRHLGGVDSRDSFLNAANAAFTRVLREKAAKKGSKKNRRVAVSA